MKFVALSFFVVVCFSAYVGSQTTTTKPAVTTTKTTPKLTTKTTPRLTTKTTTRLTTKTTPRLTTKTTSRLTTKTTPRVTTKTTPKLTTKTTTKTTTMPKTTKPTNTSSYCNIDTCPVPSEHILCVYSNTSWGAACGLPNTTKSSISAEDIEFIVGIHNQFRRIIANGEVLYNETGTQLPASNMRQLMWDDELAVIAQMHAQQCVYDYDACRDVSRFPVGQNRFIIDNVTIDFIAPVPSIYPWAIIIAVWFYEFRNMSPAYVSSFPTAGFSKGNHYSTPESTLTYGFPDDGEDDNEANNEADNEADNEANNKADNEVNNKADNKADNETNNETNNEANNETNNKANNETNNKANNEANYEADYDDCEPKFILQHCYVSCA
ncbi:hypothetical protein GHT06_014769 [Daphnia sinensis]|uniref:SCP domain-containing protein n=1 Tax=Daphnia sinensis TaxID=1820382 RepID=A0AAD5PSB7_9CRUS|nr:hypothetical protein GHT06_014769 [Daphnia sinensis]